MSFTLTPEQQMFADVAARFCADRAAAEKTTVPSNDRDTWHEAAALGFFSLWTAEATGSTGSVEAALVAFEASRSLFPGPVTATILAGSLLPDAAKGELIVTMVRSTGTGPTLIEHLPGADALLVVTADRVEIVDVADLSPEPAPQIDPLTPCAVVRDLPAGEPLAVGDLAARLAHMALVLGAAEHAGLARRTCDQAVSYAASRRQFDRPIGSFQAVKHLLADSEVEAQLAKAVALYGAGAHDTGTEAEMRRWSLSAAVAAESAALHNAEIAIQVHGGMGYAWETGVHLALRRAWLIADRAREVDPTSAAASLLAPPETTLFPAVP